MTTATATRGRRGVYDERHGKRVAERIEAARQRGFTNAELEKVMNLSGSQLWRARHGRIHPHEVEQVSSVLDDIEAGKITPTQREPRGVGGRTGYVTRKVLADRLSRVAALLDEAHEARTLKETNALVEQARAAVGGDGDGAGGDEE